MKIKRFIAAAIIAAQAVCLLPMSIHADAASTLLGSFATSTDRTTDTNDKTKWIKYSTTDYYDAYFTDIADDKRDIHISFEVKASAGTAGQKNFIQFMGINLWANPTKGHWRFGKAGTWNDNGAVAYLSGSAGAYTNDTEFTKFDFIFEYDEANAKEKVKTWYVNGVENTSTNWLNSVNNTCEIPETVDKIRIQITDTFEVKNLTAYRGLKPVTVTPSIADSEEDVDPSEGITLTFSEAVTAADGAIKVTDAEDNELQAASYSVAWNDDKDVATVKIPLYTPGATYKIVVDNTKITSALGTSLNEALTLNFKAFQETPAPTLLGLNDAWTTSGTTTTKTITDDADDGRPIHISFKMRAKGTKTGQYNYIEFMGLKIFADTTSDTHYWRAGYRNSWSQNGTIHTCTVSPETNFTKFDLIIDEDSTGAVKVLELYVDGVKATDAQRANLNKAPTIDATIGKVTVEHTNTTEVKDFVVSRGKRTFDVVATKAVNGSDLDVTYTVTNLDTTEMGTGIVIAAAYDSSNKMIAVNKTVDATNLGYATGTLKLTGAASATTVKVMVWDSLANLLPYCDVAPATVCEIIPVPAN